MLTSSSARPPLWVSRRRILEEKLTNLHKCSNINLLKQIQVQILKDNLHQDPFVASKLISAFSLCRHIVSSVNVFNLFPNPNVLLYNTLIRAYAQNSASVEAFDVFFEMQKKGIYADNFTYPFLLKACCGKFALYRIKMIHTHIVKTDFSSDIFVPNSLIDAYGKYGGDIESAQKLFDEMPERDVVTFNSMICALIKSDSLKEARHLFDEMPKKDTVSWNTILDGYAKRGEMSLAYELFEKMPERNVISWSTMLSGFSKVGDMEMARVLFDKMPVKNLVSWTIIISGYAEKGLAKEAFFLFAQLRSSNLYPDHATIISILSACAESGLLGLGKTIHDFVRTSSMKDNTHICNSLIVMYAKCGNLDRATLVFERMRKRDLVTWNSMVQGLAMHGHGDRALDLFSRMERNGFKPDGITLIGVLCACTHVGLIEKGRNHFYRMEKNYGVVPQIEHYGCMIDLLGRGGFLKEAFELVQNMPMKPNSIIWGTLLSACRIHNDVELGKMVANRLIELEPHNAGNYAMLSNIYAADGCWNEVSSVRLQMKGTGFQKPSGSSSIEVNDIVHEFTVGDRSHPQSKMIFRALDWLSLHLRQLGYVPNAQIL